MDEMGKSLMLTWNVFLIEIIKINIIIIFEI